MHCTSCKRLIEDVCKEIPGVQDCQVNFEEGTALVIHDESLDRVKLKEEIAALGEYTVDIV